MGPTEAHPTGFAATSRPHATRPATRLATRDTTDPTTGTPQSIAPRASIPRPGTTRPALPHLFDTSDPSHVRSPRRPRTSSSQNPDSNSSADAHSSRPLRHERLETPDHLTDIPGDEHAVPQPDPTRPPLVPLLRPRDRLHVPGLTPGPRTSRPVMFSSSHAPMASRSATTNLPGSVAGRTTRSPSRSQALGSRESTSATSRRTRRTDT